MRHTRGLGQYPFTLVIPLHRPPCTALAPPVAVTPLRLRPGCGGRGIGTKAFWLPDVARGALAFHGQEKWLMTWTAPTGWEKNRPMP